MGVTLTLKDTDLPTSPAFVEFLHTDLTGGEFYAGSWHAQDEESLASNEGRFENLTDKIAFVLSKPEGRQRVLQSYRYFKEMLTGRPDTIKTIQRYRFFFVIGIPRTGGTYMTKQLFRGAGMDYRKVQNALAHDGFPHLGTLAFQEQGGNIHTSGLLQLAEYLTMVDLYFTKYGRLAYNGGIVVPKKFTKGVYSFPLIHEVIGNNAEYIITLRHPLAMVQSVLDKSGGMPKGGIFNVRSAIERWALDDWLKWGVDEAVVKQMSYIDVFLGYWKRYHYQIAMEAIPTMAATHLLPYGRSHMMGAVKKFYADFGSNLEPEPFKEAPKPDFGAQDNQKGDAVVQQVALFWKSLGLSFPLEGVLERN
jgi:hypothetical protein